MNKEAVIFDFLRTLYNPDCQPLEENTIEVLEYLKGKQFKLYLIAKAAEKRLELINGLGIADYFQKILLVPKKTINDFGLCIFDAHTKAENFSVVGDRVTGEITLENQLGMLTFWYKKDKFRRELPTSEPQEPKVTIYSLRELKSHL